MWTIWGVLVAVMMALYVYRSRLTRDEEDQIFLDDSFNHIKAEQTAIMTKVNKIQPVLRIAMGLAGAMTLVVLVYYAIDIFNQFK
jgi:membrane protein insertase Oxa1/YidC/SpoIIIJ